MKHYKITLSSDDVPTQWYNINADLPVELPMPKNSEGKDQIASLQKAFTKAGLEQEFSQERYIKIPNEVRELYMKMGRPSPLFRATNLEEYFNTPLFEIPDGITKARIYIWIEGQDIDSLETYSDGTKVDINLSFIKDNKGYEAFDK